MESRGDADADFIRFSGYFRREGQIMRNSGVVRGLACRAVLFFLHLLNYFSCQCGRLESRGSDGHLCLPSGATSYLVSCSCFFRSFVRTMNLASVDRLVARQLSDLAAMQDAVRESVSELMDSAGATSCARPWCLFFAGAEERSQRACCSDGAVTRCSCTFQAKADLHHALPTLPRRS